MLDRRFQVGQLPADFDRRRLLIEWEAFIRSGFSQIGFGGEVYRFLASCDYFGRPFIGDETTAWSSHFNATAMEILTLIDVFSSETPFKDLDPDGFAGQVFVDPAGYSLFRAMIRIMDRYRDRLLAAWDDFIREIEASWIQDRVDEERYFNPKRDVEWLRDVEADLRAFFLIGAATQGYEVYMTQALRDRFVRSMPKVTRLHQPILFDLYRRRLKPMMPRRQPISSPGQPRLPIRPKQLKQKKSDQHVKRRRTDRSS
jgi:hypothetical protein